MQPTRAETRVGSLSTSTAANGAESLASSASSAEYVLPRRAPWGSLAACRICLSYALEEKRAKFVAPTNRRSKSRLMYAYGSM